MPIAASMANELGTNAVSSLVPAPRQAEAAAGEEWPILAEYERPMTTRLDHLIANTPDIQTIESKDRKAAAHQHRQSTDEQHDEPDAAPSTDTAQHTSHGEQPSRGAKRGRDMHPVREEKEGVPEHVPIFRGGGSEEDGAGQGNDVDEEQLDRVRPDELYDPLMDERDEQRLQQARGQRNEHRKQPTAHLHSARPAAHRFSAHRFSPSTASVLRSDVSVQRCLRVDSRMPCCRVPAVSLHCVSTASGTLTSRISTARCSSLAATQPTAASSPPPHTLHSDNTADTEERARAGLKKSAGMCGVRMCIWLWSVRSVARRWVLLTVRSCTSSSTCSTRPPATSIPHIHTYIAYIHIMP